MIIQKLKRSIDTDIELAMLYYSILSAIDVDTCFTTVHLSHTDPGGVRGGDDGKVPDAKPIIVLIDPDDANTSWGVLAVVGNPYPEESVAYKPVEGRVYVPIDAGTK